MMKSLRSSDTAREITHTLRGSWLARLVATGLLTASLGGSVALGALATPQLATLTGHIAPTSTHVVADGTPPPSILGGPGMP